MPEGLRTAEDLALAATLRRVVKPSSWQHLNLGPWAFSPRYFVQDRQFWLMTSMNQKPQKPNSRLQTAKDSPWHSSKPCSWVQVSATLRGVIQPSSGEHFKLWPSAFSPFYSAQEIIFWLMTSLNQRPQQPQNVNDTRFETPRDSPWHSPQLHDIYRKSYTKSSLFGHDIRLKGRLDTFSTFSALEIHNSVSLWVKITRKPKRDRRVFLSNVQPMLISLFRVFTANNALYL